MKKSGLKLLVVGILASSLLANAEIAFDLHAQHFSKAIAGKYEGARYELPSSFVSTNLNYVDGYYTTKNDNGYFNVEVKIPKIDWSVSIDTWYYAYYTTRGRSIKLISDNGESIDVTFYSDNVQFDGNKVVSSFNNSQRTSVGFIQNGNNIELYINGVKVGTAVRANFQKLKYVEVQLTNNYSSKMDDLHSLTIGSK